MPEPKQKTSTEAELIAWAIPLIADGSYSIDTEEGRRELTVYDENLDPDFMEGALLDEREAHQTAALKQAKESCTPENMLRCCVAYLGAVLRPRIAQQIEIPEYWRLVLGIYLQERALIRSVGKVFVGERERLSSEAMGRIESGTLPEAVEVMLVATYAREVADLFPQLIERAALLSVLPVTSEPPQQVQYYLQEASKCFIYARFISSLVMCRVALEEGIRDLIDKLGLDGEFRSYPVKSSEGELSRMIRFCKWRPILGVSWDDADQIRREANNAVHGNPPEPNNCRLFFETTRSVLLQIYNLIPETAGR